MSTSCCSGECWRPWCHGVTCLALLIVAVLMFVCLTMDGVALCTAITEHLSAIVIVRALCCTPTLSEAHTDPLNHCLCCLCSCCCVVHVVVYTHVLESFCAASGQLVVILYQTCNAVTNCLLCTCLLTRAQPPTFVNFGDSQFTAAGFTNVAVTVRGTTLLLLD